MVSVITLRNGGVVVRAAPGDVGNRGSEPDPAGDPEGSSISLFHDDTSCPGDHATEDLDYITLPARHPAQVENFHRDGRVEETHIFFAFNSSTGRFEQVLDVEVVELNADPIFCTGGHTHAVEDKPVTRYEPNHGITSADGTFETTANPPNAAGDEIQHIVWVPREGPSQGDTITSRSLHANRVTPEQPLERVAVSGGMVLDGITSDHLDVFYIVPAMQPLLDELNRIMNERHANPLKLNAMSLIYGGINDVANNWAERFHRFHRWGTDADLDRASNPVSMDSIRLLARMGERAGFPRCAAESDHVHCYLEIYR